MVTAAGLRAKLRSLLAVALSIVIVVVVALGYELILKAVELVVGAAAGVVAGICVSLLHWEKKERNGAKGTALIAVSGGIAGTAASVLRSMIATYSLTGSAIVGALAGAALASLAKRLLACVTYLIKKLKNLSKISNIAAGVAARAHLLNQKTKTAVKQVEEELLKTAKYQLKRVPKIKELKDGITEAAKKVSNTPALNVGLKEVSKTPASNVGSKEVSNTPASNVGSKEVSNTPASSVGSGLGAPAALGAALAALAGSAALAAFASESPEIATAVPTAIAGLAAIGIAARSVSVIWGWQKLASLVKSLLQFVFLLLCLCLLTSAGLPSRVKVNAS